MIRTIKFGLHGLLLAASSLLAQTPPPIMIGSEPYSVAGEGSPAVVFDAGFGNARLAWASIYPALSTQTTVFAFDRPGYQAAPMVMNETTFGADGKTTLSEQALHLHNLLAQAGLSPPYILVAHSIAGVTLLGFARQYPTEVAGIVFVDARLPTYTAACQKEGFTDCLPPKEWVESLPDYLRQEFEGYLATETSESATLKELGNIPAIFIAAGKANEDDDTDGRQQQHWLDHLKNAAAEMPDARYVVAEKSSHYVQSDEPELVITEINRMLTRVKTGSWPRD